MQKHLILENEQAISLYNFLATLKLDRVKNRNRWKFLEVIEDEVYAFEEKQAEITNTIQDLSESITFLRSNTTLSQEQKDELKKESTKKIKDLQEKLKNLRKETTTFIFTDREVFAQGKTLFETVAGEELQGADGRIYSKIQDAFFDVKEVEEKKK